MSYSYRQQRAEVAATSEGKVVELNDTRLPYMRPRWTNSNYTGTRSCVIKPVNSQIVFASGTNDKCIFSVATTPGVLINWSESYFQYKIRIKNGATDLTKTDANTGTYCRMAGLTDGKEPAGELGELHDGATARYIYLRNSCCPFSNFEIKDRDSGRTIETVTNPGLYAQAMLGGQPPEFWESDDRLCDEYGAGVHTFRDGKHYFAKVAVTGTDIAPSVLLPMLADDTVKAAATQTFSEVQLQQQKLWPSSNGANDGSTLKFFPISDFLNTNQMCVSSVNKLMFELTLANYGDAITDVSRILNTAATGAWTNVASTCTAFEIYDLELVIQKYYLANSEVQKVLELVSGPGVEIPFSRTVCKSAQFPATTNTLTLTINDPAINNLEKVIMVFRDRMDAASDATRDQFMLRNMSTRFLTLQEGKTAYDFSDHLAVATGYNGLYKVSCRYQSETINSEQDIIISPYHFDTIKAKSASCFGDPRSTNLIPYYYEGVDEKGMWNNCTTQFFVGLDFRTCPGAEQSGISLARSPLDITLEMKSAHASSDTSFQIDYYLICGSVLKVSTQGITLVT